MIKITEEDNKGVYVCSQLLSSIKEFKNLKELIDSKRILESGKNDLQQSGPDAIDKKYRNSIEQPIFLALKGLLELDDIYNALQNNDRVSLQTEYQNCTNEFTNVLALAQNEISGFITRYNYSPKNFKGAAVTNNYFVRTNLENLGKDGGFSHYQCFEKDKLHNHLD